MSKGYYFFHLERYEDALVEYQKELARDPQDGEIVASIANCYLRLDQPGVALKTVRDALDLEPNNSYVHIIAGICFLSNGHASAGEKHFKEAIRLDPESDQGHYVLGHYYSNNGQYKKAKPYLVEALRLDPDSETNMQALSELYSKMGDREKAQELALKALKTNPDASDAHLTMGLTQLYQGNIAEAETSIIEALRLKPNNERAEEALRDAIRSQWPIYRMLMGHSLWFSNQGKVIQWGLWIFGFVVVRGMSREMMKNPELRVIGIILAVIWGLTILYITSTKVLANVILLRHPIGKYALRKPQKLATTFILGLLTSSVLFAIILSLIKGNPQHGLAMVGLGAVLVILTSVVYNYQEDDKNLSISVGVTSGIGFLALLMVAWMILIADATNL
jgi:Tfp pilus assembly protein PilF